MSKFCDHLPLYRQADIYARSGVEIDRSVMAGWIGRLAGLLEPLSEWSGKGARFEGLRFFFDEAPVSVASSASGSAGAHERLGDTRFDIVDQQLELLNLRIELLRLAAVAGATKNGELGSQLLDQQRLGVDLGLSQATSRCRSSARRRRSSGSRGKSVVDGDMATPTTTTLSAQPQSLGVT